MTIARANCRAVYGATARSISPSRKCTCQSSGRRMVSVCDATPGSLTEGMAATTLTDRALVRLSGEDVRDFLQGLVTNDVAGELAGLGRAADAAGQMPVRFPRLGRRRRSAARLRSRSRGRSDQAPVDLSPAPPDPRSSATPSLAVHWSKDGGEGVPDPRLADLGRRWLAPADEPATGWLEHRLRLGVTRRPRRARRHPLARMQCGRAERRQLLQGLLRRPGEYRADELAAEGQPPAGRRVEAGAPDRARASNIRELGLSVEHRARRAIPTNAIIPDWLKASLAQPSTA